MKRLFDLLKLMINMIKSCVKTVNGILPDENGDVKIEVGGGLPSGGEPHQMLVTDADGKTVWEDRTHWREERTEVLFDGVVNIVEGWNEKVVPDLTFKVIEGETYNVTFDGDEYALVGMPNDNGNYIGNISLLMGEGMGDSEVPFAYSEGWVAAATNGEHSIKIVGKAVKFRKMQCEYSVSNVAAFYGGDNWDDEGNHLFYLVDGAKYEDIKGVINAGGLPILRDSNFTYFFTFDNGDSVDFEMFGPRSRLGLTNRLTLYPDGTGMYADNAHNCLVMNSSVAGSKKTFDITVNDSGQLKATERT